MDVKNVRYLNSLSDKSQYPAVRCAMGPNIYMYHCLASSVVESMNTANRQICEGVALDGLHAIILPGKLECNRFDKSKQMAWGGDSILTPRGVEEYDSMFNDIHQNMYNIIYSDDDEYWKCRV